MKDHRENAILDYLREKKEATVEELSRALFVSEPTIRRDLALLNESGKIIRTHGGAVYRDEPGLNIPLSYREREHSDAKQVIAKKCLNLISDCDTVMVDSSSSALALLKLVGVKKSLIVVTNSAKAALILSENNIKTFLAGGQLQRNSCAFTGSYAEEFLRGFNADICFFSVRTLTRDGKLTDNAIDENGIRRVMIAQSKKSVLMLDSQKISEPCPNTLCRLSDVTYVVSERDISSEFKGYEHKFL